MGDRDDKIIKNMEKNKDMENTTYELIKNRLIGQGEELKKRIDSLNRAKNEVFGSIETKLLASERIITDHNCIPSDMAPIDDLFIFGYNVNIGSNPRLSLVMCFQFTGLRIMVF